MLIVPPQHHLVKSDFATDFREYANTTAWTSMQYWSLMTNADTSGTSYYGMTTDANALGGKEIYTAFNASTANYRGMYYNRKQYTNPNILLRGKYVSALSSGCTVLGLGFAGTDASTAGEAAIWNTGVWNLIPVNGTAGSQPAAPFTPAVGDDLYLRVNVSGTTVSAKAWKANTSEPTSYQQTFTSSPNITNYVSIFPSTNSNQGAVAYTWFAVAEGKPAPLPQG